MTPNEWNDLMNEPRRREGHCSKAPALRQIYRVFEQLTDFHVFSIIALVSEANDEIRAASNCKLNSKYSNQCLTRWDFTFDAISGQCLLVLCSVL